LLAQEKVTKEKGPPDEAPSGLRPEGPRTGYGLFDGASCPDEKCLASCQAPLRGLISTRPPPHTGTRKIKSIEPTARAAARHIAIVAEAKRLP